ncbi:hypothetical protein A0K93_06445 [Corynebacterium sp. BCW_4722]|nr:hypothetical protein A0K93_06445 [Corynebacterium sp. BCW_4722]
MTKTYRITGPADQVAVDSLADELSLIDGAHEVDIDIEAGRLTVVGHQFADADVQKAARNAGYQVAD